MQEPVDPRVRIWTWRFWAMILGSLFPLPILGGYNAYEGWRLAQALGDDSLGSMHNPVGAVVLPVLAALLIFPAACLASRLLSKPRSAFARFLWGMGASSMLLGGVLVLGS